ncbi:SUN domain-containing protein 2 [Rana temporaria]|uniref:SUN domain-containing protein 2 n=1 Tax=Rana temporaria TaxID=8407 RepID=UPI001AAC87E7|nr:SUN domain-containing protein 2 [Rana temporaria]XP_040215418.1 SUN domain-containing protein 2 [Rana temporaria]XP_040215419.1 SUN domain-containing protein 2 [Rana temporaria]XP_040215420.1 SUN domain-containing protein 2 [Rana temporaria]
MSRRSKRLSTLDQEDDRNSTSSLESHVLYRDSPVRSTRRKVTTIKRAPIPQPTTEHTYYSETSTYVSRDRGGLSSSLKETDYEGSTWGESDLVRKRLGIDISHLGSKNGLSDRQTTYDKSPSSSGYSSEEDYNGHSRSQEGFSRVTRWKWWAQQMKEVPWLLFSYPGQVFGLFYWWIGTTWYRMTTSASLLDVFILTRPYNFLKKALLILLLLLILALMAAGLWHYYPFGLRGLLSVPMAAFSGSQKIAEDSAFRGDRPGPQLEPLKFQAEVMSRMKSLEKRFQGLEDEQKLLRTMELASTTDTGINREEVIQVFKGLSSSRDSALREEILQEGTEKTKTALIGLRQEQQDHLEDILQKMLQMSKDVEDQILQLRAEVKSPPQESLREHFLQDLGKLETKLQHLQQELEAVRKSQGDVSQQMAAIPGKIKGVRDEVQTLFPTWLLSNLKSEQMVSSSLSNTFLRRDELQKPLLDLEKKILAAVAADSKLQGSRAHITIDKELQASGLSGVSREEVYEIVNRALQRYSEDRIGLVDYALESSGASVLNTRCSETYETKTALLSLFGVPLWYQSQSPRVILQPDSNPGNCWAFRGSQGYAVVRLSSRIRPTAVTLDHIPRSLSPKSTISSAPKDFVVYGLEEETQKEGVLLGNFTYSQDGDPIQTFPIKGENLSTYELVELRIQSNWGHPEYTCVYRFRVHGEADVL